MEFDEYETLDVPNLVDTLSSLRSGSVFDLSAVVERYWDKAEGLGRKAALLRATVRGRVWRFSRVLHS